VLTRDDNERTPDAMTDLQNLLNTFYRAFSGEPPLLETVVTPDWEDLPPAPGQQPGPAGAQPVIEAMSAGLSDLHVVIRDVVDGRDADGAGTVAVRAEMSGLHTGELLGAEPTGRPVRIALHEFHQVRDGKICKTWHLEDWEGFFRQVRQEG
jgi:predicted ester cyclase